MTITNKRSLIALLMSLVLVVSLFTIGISADETTTDASETTKVTEGADSETDSSADTTKKEETTTAATTTAQTEAGTLSESQKNLQKTLIINAVIVAVIIVILVAVGIKFRKKLSDFFRSVKSERKKIVWSSKENTKKSFLVVIVVAIAIALLLFVVDFAFKTGLGMLHDLVK